MNELNHEVILAILKLSRAMRRCPPERGEVPFPPAVGRLLNCAAENPGVSSRELCELLDVRPSSLSEMLARAETDGLLTRTADAEDRRIQRITLTDQGRRIIAELRAFRDQDAAQKTACLSEEEKKQFCDLCNRLSGHIERLALDLPEDRPMPPEEDGPGPRPSPRKPHRNSFPIPPEKRFKC